MTALGEGVGWGREWGGWGGGTSLRYEQGAGLSKFSENDVEQDYFFLDQQHSRLKGI